MPRKARALDLRAAIAVPEKTVEVLNITFAELCATYCAVAQEDGADLRLKKWVEAFGETSAWEVSRDMLERCIEAMLAVPYKGSTINRDISQIGSVYKWARGKRMSPKGHRSPTLDIPRLEEAIRVVHMSDDECRRLLAGARASRDRRFAAYVALLHDTGARPSEILERRWADVDLDRATMLADKTKTDRPRVLFFNRSPPISCARPGPSASARCCCSKAASPARPSTFAPRGDAWSRASVAPISVNTTCATSRRNAS